MEDKDILKDKIRRTNFRFLGTYDVQIKQDINGNVAALPVYNNGGFIIMYDTLLNKIYNKQIVLNPNTLRVLIYFAKHIGFNTNVIKVTQAAISKEMKISQPQVNSAIQDLKDIRLIEARGHSEYIMNHNYIFRGNMLKFYEDYKALYPDEQGEIYD